MTTSASLPEAALHTVTFAIGGMTCSSCASHVHGALADLAGVRSAQVDRKRALAVVVYDPTSVRPADMVLAIEEAGYDASLRTNESKPPAV